jgi:hypothetical protein
MQFSIYLYKIHIGIEKDGMDQTPEKTGHYAFFNALFFQPFNQV